MRKGYLSGCFSKDFVLLQDLLLVCFGGDLEEGDALDGGHFVFCCRLGEFN